MIRFCKDDKNESSFQEEFSATEFQATQLFNGSSHS